MTILSTDTMTRLHQLVDAQAQARPDAPMARDHDGRTVTWGALDAATHRLAGVLGEAGVRPGDRVMIVAENSAALVAAFYACSRLDAWALLVNARASGPELAAIAQDAGIRLAVYTTAVSPDAGTHAQTDGARPFDDPVAPLAIGPAHQADPEPVQADAGQVAALLYTTGTTGKPKGVMLSHGNLLFAGQGAAALRGTAPDDILYGALPLTHVYGLASMLGATATAGAQLWFDPRFTPAGLLAAIRGGVSILPAVPQMHALFADHIRAQGLTTLADTRLRFVSSGGAPLDPELRRRAERVYGVPMQNGYGMTEATAGITVTNSQPGDDDTSTGLPFPGVEVRLDVQADAADGVGEILTRGPHVMRGYYGQPQATAAVLCPDGWLRTGDLGRLDDAGRLYVVGRLKELIIRSGFNVYPVEVEAALVEHPDVLQAAVVGRALPGGNEEVVAFVRPAEGAGLDEPGLRAHVAARLSPYKRPGLYVITDTLPATPTGKVLKHKLIAHFADRLPALAEPGPGQG